MGGQGKGGWRDWAPKAYRPNEGAQSFGPVSPLSDDQLVNLLLERPQQFQAVARYRQHVAMPHSFGRQVNSGFDVEHGSLPKHVRRTGVEAGRGVVIDRGEAHAV